MADESVIIISDSEASNQSAADLSLVQVDDADSSIIITYSTKPEVLPHARSDCSSQHFCSSENDRSYPLTNNGAFCEQCYCYICDGLASQCKHWTTPGLCHCNAHNKSGYWKKERLLATVGPLGMFNLSTELIDDDIKNAGMLLHTFTMNLKPLYEQYLMGVDCPDKECFCSCHFKVIPYPMSFCNVCSAQHGHFRDYRYQPVFSAVEAFVNDLGALGPSGKMVALLGVTKEIMLHKEMATSSMHIWSNWKNVMKRAVVHLMQTIQLQAHVIQVEHDLPCELLMGLKNFYYCLFFPTHCNRFYNSMFIFSWDEPILLSVIRGQNMSDEISIEEDFDVVVARKNKLEQEKKYQELIRYLSAVKANNNDCRILKSEIPRYLCKLGRSFEALRWMTKPTESDVKHLPPVVVKEIIIDASKLIHDTVDSASREKPALFLMLSLRVIFLHTNLQADIDALRLLVELLCTSPTPGGTGCPSFQALECPSQWLFKISHTAVEDICNVIMKNIPNIPIAFSSMGGCVIIATGFIIRNFLPQLMRPDNLWNLLQSFGPNMWAVEFLLNTIKHYLHFTFVGDMKSFAYHEGMVERFALQNLEQCCALTDVFMKVNGVAFHQLGIYFAGQIYFFIIRNHTIRPEKKEFVNKWMTSKVIPLLIHFNTQESLDLLRTISFYK